MISDGKTEQISENLVNKEPLFESSINGRETFYEEVKAPKTPEEGEWTGFMRNYRRNPPIELTDEQKLEQFQSMRPFEQTETMQFWQHQFSEQLVTFDFQKDSGGFKFDLYQGQYLADVKKRRIISEEEIGVRKH